MSTKTKALTRTFSAGVFQMGATPRWLGGAELLFPSAVLAPATTKAAHAGLVRSPGTYWVAARPPGNRGVFLCAPVKEFRVGQAPGAHGTGHLAVGLNMSGWALPPGAAGWPAAFENRVCSAETAAEIDDWFRMHTDPGDAWRTAAAQAIARAAKPGAVRRGVPSWATSPISQVERFMLRWPVKIELRWPR